VEEVVSRFAVICIVLLTTGCQYDPYASEFTRARPAAESIPGQYVLTAESREFIRSRGKYSNASATISLNADGTFSMASVPDLWMCSGVDSPRGFADECPDVGSTSMNGEGRWEITKRQDWYSLRVVFSRMSWSNGKRFDREFGTEVNLIGEKAPYTLFLTIGDPDAGDALQFAQAQRNGG
jgi:hypothetical protein